MPQLKPDKFIGSLSKRFQNSVLKINLSKNFQHNSSENTKEENNIEKSRNFNSLNDINSIKDQERNETSSPLKMNKSKTSGNILQTKSLNKYFKKKSLKDYSNNSPKKAPKFENSKIQNRDILFDEEYEEKYSKIKKSKPFRRYFDENKNMKMLLANQKENGRYKSLK